MAKGKGGFLGQDGLNAPDQATGVSGSAGDGQVTVSWNNPSSPGSTAITGYQIQSNNGDGTYLSSYDIANASYDDLSSNFTSKDSDVRNFNFSADGSYLFIPGGFTDTVYRYSLATPWDLTTVTDDSNSKDTSAQATSAMDVWFKPDGTIMYVSDNNTSAIYQYTLSTAYDLSTASYASKSLSVSSQGLYVRGMAINDDGTKFYAFSSNDNTIYQYNASTAYDISTASYASKSFNPSSDAPAPSGGISFNSDGTELFVCGASADAVYKFDLSTAYDISTASYSGVSFAVGNSITTPHCVRFGNSGTKMFVINSPNDTIYQYTSGLNDYPTSSPVTITGLTNGTSYTFNVWAINSSGWSAPSEASEAVSPTAPIAVFSGWYTTSSPATTNDISQLSLSSAGNTSDWGDLKYARGLCGACGNSTYGYWAAGSTNGYSSGTYYRIVDYITYSSQGNAAEFGNLSSSPYGGGYRGPSGASNSTRGLFWDGIDSGGNTTGKIDYITLSTSGSGTNFGNSNSSSWSAESNSALANSTRCLYKSGLQTTTEMRYVTIATTGNSLDFGDITQTRAKCSGSASATRGLWNGGSYGGTYYNIIDYVTIASTGNATDFGDLVYNTDSAPATGSATRSVCASGQSSAGRGDTIDTVNFASTGNATDYGDLSRGTSFGGGATSNSHGGLQ